jgi:outer membrane protein assembly factor BamB
MRFQSTFVGFLLLLWVSSRAFSEDGFNWQNWRGPHANGSIAQGSYPDELDPNKCAWKIELPGKGCSTPIVSNQNIFVTVPIDGNDGLLCYELTGKEKWRAKFGKENPGKHANGSGSNASPITDGKAVFCFYKSGTLAAVENDGKVRWQTDLVERFGKDTLYWDHGTSPVITEKFVVMVRMHEGESWLAAFDKQSGEMAWKVARNYQTPQECDHGYTTPLVIRHAGQESILVWGAEHVTIHNASNGEVVWICGGFNPEESKLWPAIATPVLFGETGVIAYGRNDRGIPRLYGVRLTGIGDVTNTNQIWKREDVGTFVPTPAAHDDHLILVRDRGEVECLDPQNGKTVWKEAFPKNRSNFYSSPLIAGDKLYAPREDGVVFVASLANGKFEVLSENNMGESVIGSPVPISADKLIIRGVKHLFCFANQ